MLSPESMLHMPTGKLSMPSLPGLDNGTDAQPKNPFSGIRRAGQAKRAENFMKFGQHAPNTTGDGKPQFGAQAGTQMGSMRQMKF